MPHDNRYDCPDCGDQGTHIGGGFMATKEAWGSAGLGRKDCHCLRCFEQHLGRSVGPRDFLVGALINDNLFFAFSKADAVGLSVYRQHLTLRCEGL